MHKRLFTQMLIAFTLVIVLGVGGMALLFGMAFVDAREASRGPPWESNAVQIVSEELQDYYSLRGSWDGVTTLIESGRIDQRTGEQLQVTLLDAEGRLIGSSHVIAGGSSHIMMPRSEMRAGPAEFERRRSGMESFRAYTVPLAIDGRNVGTLFVSPIAGMSHNEIQRRFLLGIASAGFGLMAILLGFAFFFSRRINRPLQQLTGAARRLAEGDMSARVTTHSAHEIDMLAQSFNRMADNLAEADRQRRQLTADVAHELRTPLSVVKGRLEGIQDGVYRADGETIAALLDSTALLERLIDDLRLLALAEAGQLPLHREIVDPQRLLEDAARSFAQQATAQGAALEILPGEATAEIYADPQRISQVLGNLLNNALQYGASSGHITLSLATDEQRVWFAVSDDGPGIANEDLAQIFERFWRADRSRSRSSGGAGLGLAIARQIIEAHDGGIRVASELGQGTTISFWLPREEA
jgi:signal transduction histidine kinase